MKKFLKILSLFIILMIFGSVVIFVTGKIYMKSTEKTRVKPLTLEELKTNQQTFPDREMSFLEKVGLLQGDEKQSRFDGYYIPQSTDESPVAIMIENHTLSRPQQAGLSEASVVYETLAEGGITRFMAIFPYQSYQRIGPIRSIRPYFLSWALEHAQAIVHAGGSDEALGKLYTSALQDIDEDDLDPKKLFRDTRYEKPHNLFANLTHIRELDLPNKNKWKAMPFEYDSEALNGSSATEITFNFSSASYKTSFIYLPESRHYERYQNGDRSVDSLNKNPITPSNIIVQITETVVLDDAGRLDMRTMGVGKAMLFRDGKVTSGTWKKENENSVTKFLTDDNKPFTLLPGQTWIIVIDSENKINYN
jgi:hypothetical protein